MKHKQYIFLLSIATAITLASCSLQDAAATKSKSEIKVDQSYSDKATVYQTVKQLADDSDYIFQGVLSRTEPVEGAAWEWHVFQVSHLYKGYAKEKEIRMVGRTDADALTLTTGSDYLVFATAYELPVYPWPLINPVYNQAIFEVKPDGGIQIADTVDKTMIPAVFAGEFSKNYQQMITDSVVSVIQPPMYSVATSYQDKADMLAHADLVAKVTFSEVEYINEFVSIGKVDQIQSEYMSEANVIMPATIAFSEELKAGEEYLIFLRYDSEHDGLVLAARHGAIVRSTDFAKWRDTLTIFQ